MNAKIKIKIMILSSILTFLGCKNKEEKFLETHTVIFYNSPQYKEFEKTSKVKIKEANKIQANFAIKNDKEPEMYSFFVVDNQYVFTSYFHPKIPDASTRGIWVDATTGEAKYIEEQVWLKAYDAYNHPFR